jgi:hypothetical protein
MTRKIAVIEIPHQLKAKLYWYYDIEEFINTVYEIACAKSDIEINTFEDAKTYLSEDLHGVIVVTDDSDLDYVLNYTGHQAPRIRAFAEEIKDEWGMEEEWEKDDNESLR